MHRIGQHVIIHHYPDHRRRSWIRIADPDVFYDIIEKHRKWSRIAITFIFDVVKPKYKIVNAADRRESRETINFKLVRARKRSYHKLTRRIKHAEARSQIGSLELFCINTDVKLTFSITEAVELVKRQIRIYAGG